MTTARRTVPRQRTLELDSVIDEYLRNRSMRERSEYHEGTLKKALLEYLEHNGVLRDGGHRSLELDPPFDYQSYKGGKPQPKRVTGIDRQKRSSEVLNEDRTMALLKELNLVDQCTEVIVVLNEDAVLAANYEGKISDEQLKTLYDGSDSYAFYLVTEDQ
jgi:hypothetical protein